MKIKQIIKNNIKLYIVMAIIIILGTIGITYAVTIGNFNAIAINTTAATLDANITYDAGYSANITNTGNMLPINDNLVTGPNVNDTRVLKVKFKVSGVSSNPQNTIFDIALYATNIDCELRTKDLKWRVYRSNTLISEGNLSPTFDTMANNRLVLTETQENLDINAQDYTFLLWISESCTGDITSCDPSLEQSKYLNKSLSGAIKLELSTNTRKTLKRTTGSEFSCDYTTVQVPLCNNLTYNGSEQILVNTTSSTLVSSQNNSYKILPLGSTLIANTNPYTVSNNKGVNAGSYPIMLSLEEGYKWIDGSTEDKCIYCSIVKKPVTITTLNQSINYGTDISNTSSNYNISSLVSGDTLNSISLNTDIADVGTGQIKSSNAKIINSTGTDVTNNYNIKYQNTGIVTINCSKSAVMPTATSKKYTGSSLTGITGGTNVTIKGIKSATQTGEYSVVVTPNKNYCWSDGTTTTKPLFWNIWNIGISIIDTIKNLYTSGNPTLITQETSNDKYYYSYQDTGKTWGLMNDGLKVDNTLDATTPGLVTTITDTTALTSGTEGNIRYFGASDSVNNYIYFNCKKYPDTNCELWRIIGIVDGKVKIIRDASIGAYSWDNKNTTTGASTSDGSNNWSNARLMRLLNPDYENYIDKDNSGNDLVANNSLYWNSGSGICYSGQNNATKICDFTANGLKNNTTRNMISESIWYLGGNWSGEVYPNEIYTYERTTARGGYPFSITAKTGLMYASDYGYATDLSKCSDNLSAYNSSTDSYACRTNNWLFKNIYEWLITTNVHTYDIVWLLSDNGGVCGSHDYAFDGLGVRPVIYLNSELSIELGHEGTSTDPYRIIV